MTYLVKCDGCGKVLETPQEGVNPIDDVTHQKWWSRVDGDKNLHACSRDCMDGGLVWPM